MMDEFTKKPEIIFITYDEVIKSPYPFILKQISTRYKQFYEPYLDLSRIEKMDENNLDRLCVQRTDKNLFRYLSKIPFDFDKSMSDILNKFDDMYFNCPLMKMGTALTFLLSQKFTQKVYIYTEKYDKRVHLDIQTTYRDMDRVNYITGNFDEVICSLNGVTSYILNDINYLVPLIHHKKTEYTNILVGNFGYNYALNDQNQMVLRINIDEWVKEFIFKFATFMPIEFTDEHFTTL